MSEVVEGAGMRIRAAALLASAMAASLAASTRAQEHAWRDPSPHQVRTVTVADNVRLEVLDWGGTGRPIVLLTGLGNTAHVYDAFAPKLTGSGHVYGITRRGYGDSSKPESGYSANRLGDDVLAVIDALDIRAPILVGHSIAGQELSSVASRRPDRIAGVVYLDALFSYAYLTPDDVALRARLSQLQQDLQTINARPLSPVGVPQPSDLLPKVIRAMADLQQQLSAFQPAPAPPPSTPSAADLESFAAYAAWFTRIRGLVWPEAEFRQLRDATPDGRVGASRTPAFVPTAILAGAEPFSSIGVPALALVALPDAADQGNGRAQRETRAAAFEKNVARSRVVRVSGANHYVFLSHEADVLREIAAFVKTLG